jgi:hypothetical protein
MAGAPGANAGALVRGALWLLLGGWLGAWTLFALGVAPVVFRVLPSRSAGAVVGPVLSALHLYGAFAGAALAGLALRLRRGRFATLLPLAMAAVCLGSELVVTPAIDRAHGLAFGPAGSAEDASRFWQLHGVSMTLFAAVGGLALVLAGLHARADARSASPRGGSAPSRPMSG